MSNKDTKQVLTGAPDKSDVAGYAFFADLTVARPTEATAAAITAIKADYKGLGYLDNGGVSIATNVDSEKKYDWGGDVVAVLRKATSATLKFTVIQRSADAMRYVWGKDAVQTTGTGSNERITRLDLRLDELPHQRLAFLLAGADNAPEILDIGDSQVTDVGDLKFVKDDLVAYEVTVELFKVDGAFARQHIGEPKP